MDMDVDPPGRDDLAFSNDDLRSWSNNYGHFWLDVRITCFTYSGDPSVLDTEIGLDNSPVVENERISDYRVDCSFVTRTLRLPHAVANNFPAAELRLFTIRCTVLFYFDNEIRICKAHLIADCWAKHLRISVSFHCLWHLRYLIAGKGP